MKQGSKPSAVIDEFTPWLALLREQGRSPRTVLTYASAVKNFSRYIRRRCVGPITAITKGHLDDWRRHLVDSGCKPATVDLFVRALRGAFTWLVQTGRLFLNPADGLAAPKVPRQINVVPSEADMRRLLESITVRDAVGIRDHAILETAYATGARLEELVRLDIGSIDAANRLLRLRGKGAKDRLVPLTETALTVLDDYVRNARPSLPQGPDEPALFLSSRGGHRLAFYAIEGVVRRRAHKVGLVLTPHAIRRAFATHLLRAGASPADIRELLGHRSYRHLGHYLQFHPDEMSAKLQNARPCRR
jgi:integrase/recombinase XerD